MPTRVYIARRIIPFEHGPRFHTAHLLHLQHLLLGGVKVNSRRFSGTAEFIVLVGHAATTSPPDC